MTTAVIPEIAFMIQARSRDEGIALADRMGNTLLSMIGGEPWVMVDDDWKKLQPPMRLTLTDDQGYMYQGMRKYVFQGPLIGSQDTPMHDGYRVQHALSDE